MRPARAREVSFLRVPNRQPGGTSVARQSGEAGQAAAGASEGNRPNFGSFPATRRRVVTPQICGLPLRP